MMWRWRNRIHILQVCFSLTTSSSVSKTQPVQSFVFAPFFIKSAVSSENFLKLFQVSTVSQQQFNFHSMTSSGSNSDNGSEKHTRDFQSQSNDTKEALGLGAKAWRSLIEVSIAKSRKIRGSNYVQLATVDPVSKEPRCRTVVFRGFQIFPSDHFLKSVYNEKDKDDLSCVMKMCTDRRSRKVYEAATEASKNRGEATTATTTTADTNSVGEIVWWFPKSSEQYRLRGTILFVGGGVFPHDNDTFLKQARKELWGNLSDAARESFLEENVTGQPVLNNNPNSEKKLPAGGRDEETGKPVPPPDNFLLMLLFPHHVDYLNLKHNYRQIDEVSPSAGSNDNQWSFKQVNA